MLLVLGTSVVASNTPLVAALDGPVTQPAPHAPLPPGTPHTAKPTITLDYTEAPEFGAWMEQVAKPLLEQWYPVLVDYYAYPHHHAEVINSFKLTVDADYTGVAAASAGDHHIWIGANYLRNHMDDGGMLIHEAMHLIQYNPARESSGLPSWIIEGWADHAREKVYQDRPFRGPSGDEVYLNGYGTASFLLEATDNATSTNFLKELSIRGWEGTYTDETYKEISGGMPSWQWYQATGQAATDVGAFTNLHSGRCLDLPFSNSDDGTRMQLWDCNETGAQRWIFKATAPDSTVGVIMGELSRRCLTVLNNANTNGSAVAYKNCNSAASPGQKWQLINGTYRNTNSGKCLQPVAGGTASGTLMEIQPCSTAPTQQWTPPRLHDTTSKVVFPTNFNGVPGLAMTGVQGGLSRQIVGGLPGHSYQQPQLSPDGHTVAYYRVQDGQDIAELMVARTDIGREQELSINGHHVTKNDPSPIWSADGKQLLVVAKPNDEPANDAQTWVWVNPLTGEQQTIASGMIGVPFAATAERIYFYRSSSADSTWCSIQAQAGSDEQCFGSVEATKAAALSPDGTRIAWLPASETAKNIRLTTVGDQTEAVFELPSFGDKLTEIDALTWLPHSSALAFRAVVNGKPAWYSIDTTNPGTIQKLNLPATDSTWWSHGAFSLQGGAYTALAPSRITDTRPGSGQLNAGKTLGQQSTLDVRVTGVGGVPATGVSTVVLNVTAASATAAGYLTVFPAGASRPNASTVNTVSNQVANNQVTVGVGRDGKVSIFNAWGNTDVVVDVVGYYSASGSTFTPTAPKRIIDTRDPRKTLPAGGSLSVQVTDKQGIPNNAVGVVADVTAVNTTGNGYLTLYPSDAPRPNTSSLNYRRDETITKEVNVKLSSSGALTVANPVGGSADFIIDVVGYYTADATGLSYMPINPSRIADTRAGSGQPFAGRPLGPNSDMQVGISGAIVPGHAAAVITNLTIASATTGTFMSTYPVSATTPPTSTAVTYIADVAFSQSTVLLSDGATSGFKVRNKHGTAEIVIDVQGYYY